MVTLNFDFLRYKPFTSHPFTLLDRYDSHEEMVWYISINDLGTSLL